MTELDKWMQHLLDTEVSAEGIKEFERIYKDILYSTSISEEQDVKSMFAVIDMMGEDTVESETLRRYLYFIYGAYLITDLYAGVIGEFIGFQSDKNTVDLLNALWETAIDRVKELK
jgi:hypothetical protein